MQLIHTYYGCAGDGCNTTIALPVDTESKDFAKSQIFWAVVHAAYAGARTFDALGHTHHTHNFLTHMHPRQLAALEQQAKVRKCKLPIMAKIGHEMYALKTGKLLTFDEWQKACTSSC